MCNLGEGIYEDGLMKGREEGKKKVNWNLLSNR